MMRFDRQFLIKALPKAELLFESFPRYPHVSVDSRTVKDGELFVALKGEHVDGHDYIEQALDNGAVGIIVDTCNKDKIAKISKSFFKDKLVVVVDNTLDALLRMATAWREQFDIPVVGITGSVGKTSTKENIKNILDEHQMDSCVAEGNLNSLIGLSISVLKIKQRHQIAVFELGINKRGEMSKLVDIAKPTIGVITSVGHSHMAGLGSLADIAEEKRAIFKFFKEDNIGVVNGDQALLSQIGYMHPVIRFGSKTTNQIQARKTKIVNSKVHFTLKIYQEKFPNVVIDGNHEGAAYNALAAVSVACLLNIPTEVAVKGIQRPLNLIGRFQFKKIGLGQKGVLVDDCYNASPESMKISLQAFENLATSDKKVAVLGDMGELGVDSLFWHRQVGRFIRKVSSLQYLILVGDLIHHAKKTLPASLEVDLVADWKKAFKLLEVRLKEERSTILVKGSTKGYKVGLAELVTKLEEKEDVDVGLIKPARRQSSKGGTVGQIKAAGSSAYL